MEPGRTERLERKGGQGHPDWVQTLRVVTLNLWNKSGPWPARRALICRELGRLAPDVVGLQELLRLPGTRPLPALDPDPEHPGTDLLQAPWPWTGESDQLSELVESLGEDWPAPAHLAFAPAKEYGGGLWMGNGLLSRHPLLEARGFQLPGEESGEKRSLLYALLDTPWGRLPVFVTHLNWKWHHGSIRLRQVQALVARIEGLVAPEDARTEDMLPPVLMGDFNAEPDSDEIRYLRGLHTIAGKSVFFADAWAWAGDGSAGFTFERANGFAARSNEPPRRIDYVFVQGPDRWLRGEPLRCGRAFDQPERSAGSPTRIWPSDHYGLVVDLAAERRSAPE